MKTIKMILMTLLFGLFLSQGSSMNAQTPVKVSSKMSKKVLLENEKVLVTQVVFSPGAKTDWHNHPNHVVYAETSGKLELTEKGKPVKIIDIKAGTAMYMPAVTHIAKNVGTTTIKLIVTEMKPVASTKTNSKTTTTTTVKK